MNKNKLQFADNNYDTIFKVLKITRHCFGNKKTYPIKSSYFVKIKKKKLNFEFFFSTNCINFKLKES